ncbi:MAG: hypothetical protein OXI96_04875 [Acidimicrobiaceae bacterium]|nr:hypothetical protein [Acidimicrobiaceae bacterium]
MGKQPAVSLDTASSKQAHTVSASSLSYSQRLILAVLSRRPRGLLGTTSVAAASSVSVDEARETLAELEDQGLVTSEWETMRWCSPPKQVKAWRLRISEVWFSVAAEVRATPIPILEPEPMPDRLPKRLSHLFWWGDPSAIELPRDAVFVAEHLLTCHDIAAWGWVVTSLPRRALERVAAKDHILPEVKAMIHNALMQRHVPPV